MLDSPHEASLVDIILWALGLTRGVVFQVIAMTSLGITTIPCIVNLDFNLEFLYRLPEKLIYIMLTSL
ncbi:hypothetical protein N7462_004210 [Penicillium macrosclerotiorum]|uniref:uncharacterized protein n=1 Tax=Penicillium macrosclerotiorum TaxID=303699 RepID=UPI0025472F81|nr:uncharacterized protein N7462_004210 [Penicillium macrosclerotiorum]KAJ5689818.1 hypothetical protein N7462_004210 [Penicillium macrosclerotiorum]